MINTITANAPRGLYNNHVKASRGPTTSADAKFLLAAGSAGIEAATNIVVR